jgi:hypothetical protein
MRYDHYSRKLKERVTALKAFLRETHTRSCSTSGELREVSHSRSISQSIPDKEERLKRALAKQREVMLLKIQEEHTKNEEANAIQLEEQRYQLSIKRAREDAKELIRQSSARRELRMNKVKEKASQLQSTQERKDRATWRRSLRKRAQEVMNHTNSEICSAQRSALETTRRQQEYEEKAMREHQSEQLTISEKLRRFEEKMNKHDTLHKGAIKQITDKIAVKAQRVKGITQAIEALRETDETKRARRFVEKQLILSHRQATLHKERQLSVTAHRRTQLEKRRLVESRVSSVDCEIRTKSLSLDRRMQASAQVLKRKFKAWNHELSVRHELAKIKNEDTLETAERRNRIAAERRLQIMDKHLRDSQRLEDLKQAREMLASQSREIQIRTAQDRNRLKADVGLIVKSPESARAKEIVKELGRCRS